MADKEKNKIIINISNIDETKALNLNNIIHKDAWEAVLKIIEEVLKKAENYNPQENFNRYHNTISINGERGAGKTSFLLTLRACLNGELKDCLNGEVEKEKNIVSKTYVLGIIDPTLISTRQHVLLLILSLIQKAVNRKFNDISSDFDESKKDKWHEYLVNLAEGLNQIDNIGTNPLSSNIWDDSGLVIERGLELANAGLNFEKNFHIFIKESLEILDKKAFILFLDDIDTDFSKGWEILETLRKFITTPQIIPIMAGNFSLYEKLVRENRWQLFEKLLKFEDRKKDLEQQVDELTEQYLMKILQPSNMVNLHKFSYYLFYQNKYKIYINQGN